MIYLSIALILISVILLAFGLISGKKYKKYCKFVPKDYSGISFLITGGIALGKKFKIFEKLSEHSESFAKHKNKIESDISFAHGKTNFEIYKLIYCGIRWVYFLIGLFLSSGLCTVMLLTEYASEIGAILILGVILVVVLPLTVDMNIKKVADKKRNMIISEFPLFLNKMMLLVNSGATVSNSWQKIATDKNNDENANPLYSELLAAQKNMKGGLSESDALQFFARECNCREITRAVGVISTNLKKGGADVVSSLRGQVDECFELRKNRAKTAGEKASTKMTFPMMLTLISMIIAIGYPAFVEMSSII